MYLTPEEWRRRAMNVNRQQVLPPFDNQVMEQVVQENAAEGGYQVGLVLMIIITIMITITITTTTIMIMIMILIITAFSGSTGGGRSTG